MIKGAGFMDFYTAIVILVIVMVVVNGIDIFSNRLIGIRMKRNILITCSLIVFALFFEWLGVKVNGVASHIEIHKLAKLLEFSIAPLIAVFATVSYSKIRHPKIITAVMTAHIIFEAVALHFGWVISVDSSGRYHRGPLYPVYILVFSISIIYCMICVLKTDVQYYSKPSLVLLAILAFLAIGICFQMLTKGERRMSRFPRFVSAFPGAIPRKNTSWMPFRKRTICFIAPRQKRNRKHINENVFGYGNKKLIFGGLMI